MYKIGLCFFLLLLMTAFGVSGQQISFSLRTDIPVTGPEGPLAHAWNGGLDAPQVNRTDLDGDGIREVILFDRATFQISVYSASGDGWEYRPELADVFPPDLNHWMLLRDFNGDGKEDLFTSSPLGMTVYVNISEGDNIRWRLYHSRAPGPSPLMTTGFSGIINLQVNATDIPDISDIDDDGDLDVLVFRFTGNSSVEWHRNMAVELTGTLDSMQFVRETQRWGNFEECNCGEFALGGTACAPQSGKVLHEGGKSLLVLDWDGDGDKDALISEETCSELYLLTSENGEMVSVSTIDRQSMPFPAAYLEDVTGDEIPDLVLASNLNTSTNIPFDFSQTFKVYPNRGTTVMPDFAPDAISFIQEEMLDAGSGASVALHDIDRDGDQDLFISSRFTAYDDPPHATIRLYENTGSQTLPEYVFRENDFAGLSTLDLINLQIQFRDINRDGTPDLLFLGDNLQGQRRLYAIEAEDGAYSGSPYVLFDQFLPFDSFSMNLVDDDAVWDLLVARASGQVDYYRGDYVEQSLQLSLEQFQFLGLDNDPFRTRGRLLITDVDGDGQKDAVYTYGNGEIQWSPGFSIDEPAVFQPLPTDEPAPQEFGSFLWLEPIVLNGDGISFIAGTGRGGLYLFEIAGGTGPEADFLVYPNPVSLNEGGVLYIRNPQPAAFSIVNLLGQEVRAFSTVPSGTNPLALGTLHPGMYILVGRQGGEVIFSQRIVITD